MKRQCKPKGFVVLCAGLLQHFLYLSSCAGEHHAYIFGRRTQILRNFLCGFVKLDGAYFETIAINMLYLYVLTPRKRKNIQKNTFAEEYKELLKREEQIKISKMDAATKKKYMATHGPKKKITYSSREEFKVYR